MTIQQSVSHNILTVLSLVAFLLLPGTTLTANPYQLAMQPATAPGYTDSQDYCERRRLERQRDINNNPDIDLRIPLRQTGDANCFTPAENLYFVSLVSAQDELGKNAPWYDNMSVKTRKKAELACQVMGYGEGPLSMSYEDCIDERFLELMEPYNDEYREESAIYINKRNRRSEEIVKQCVTAFHQNLPQLPRQIQFPLAYYDKKLHSYPAWYFEGRLDDEAWIESMQETRASDVVTDALGEQCPGDMVFWLYLSG